MTIEIVTRATTDSEQDIRNRVTGLVCVTALAAPVAASADSMRCGKWVVSESVTVGELLSKCGEPQSRNVTKDDVYMTTVNGTRVKTERQTVTERWIYRNSSRSLPMLVVIVDGKIVSLTRADS
ncbi:hypothetical protein GCM10011487_37100 [Steroidobacter agaridevorans]|uniref:DUF2845 domain-containing protein n=1 Tax=Steroidobacter agaridevorans TaxID=2695856 RepID=A0A829YER4_9GAMM|nr:DUF2845 domain-containing protein [Steroidobacter agaridevorans]GFE81710.1 hypothetical protein GCM10011487_37100 [Steroidobacter agaridevorans]GFE90454.1 hypothetical protein GCM10011488_54080 [Steroidobacter agaridevorans]